MQLPTLADVYRARRLLAGHLLPTPLLTYPALDRLVGTRVFVKHENHLPTGAFKIRGGLYLLSRMSAAEGQRGVVTASTGNHGQSIAMAAARFGVRARVFAPRGANPVKVEAMQGLGAEVVLAGKDFEEAKARAMETAEADEARFISSGDEPDLIAGVATHTLEILEQQPDIDTVIVPVGGGSGAAGSCLVAKSMGAGIRVIGVQAAAAPAAYLTWKHRQPTTARIATSAEGLATGAPFALPQRLMQEHLDDFLLVEDEAMLDAVRILLEKAKTLAEPAGAASLAAALQLRQQLAGRKVALILSGGNISPEQLRECLDRVP